MARHDVNVDTREMILATIRVQLLDYAEVGCLDPEDAFGYRYPGDEDRQAWSVAEYVLDAATARGAQLADVCAAVAVELVCIRQTSAQNPRMSELVEDFERVEADAEGEGLFDERFDHVADLSFGPIRFPAPVEGLCDERFSHADPSFGQSRFPAPVATDDPFTVSTLADLRRLQTLRLLYLLSKALDIRASGRVTDAFFDACYKVEPGTRLGEVLGREERREQFIAGLYDDTGAPTS
jgi:hypothetical protein